jgi:NAD(P)H-nitrite reductase large subunit
MTGRIDEDKLFFWKKDDDPRLTVRNSVNVDGIDREDRRVRLENGEDLHYDRMILAPGGRPFIPPACSNRTCGLGVFPVRDLASARAVRKWIPDHREITVLGGGLVGIKTAVQLRYSGFPVTLVEKENHLLPNLLSPDAANHIADHLQGSGLDVRAGSTVDEIRGDDSGCLKAVRISGKWLACRTLLVAIGSTPKLDFLVGSGFLINNELVVTPALQTSDQSVFAAGDAVTIKTADGVRYTPWTWPQAVIQGKLAGANLFRDAPVSLGAMTRVNAQNIAGMSIAVLGARPPGSAIAAGPVLPGPGKRELFVQNNRIAGGALIGDISGAGRLHAAMIAGENVANNISELAKAGMSAITGNAWRHLGQRRRARFYASEGNTP